MVWCFNPTDSFLFQVSTAETSVLLKSEGLVEEEDVKLDGGMFLGRPYGSGLVSVPVNVGRPKEEGV